MKKKLNIILINLLVIFVLGEIVVRILPKLFEKPPPYNTAQLDEELGWYQKGGYQFEGEQLDFSGETYPLSFSFHENGFRKFGNNQDDLPKLLVIGDSFTQAIEVSDGKTYYDYLNGDTLFNVFAYGLAGYGTLQEYLILDKYIDDIQPDVVVWQVCSNDFIDNEFELEKNALYRVGLKRPYLDNNGDIFYRNPLPVAERILIQSKFLKFINDKWIRVKHKLGIKKKNSSEERIGQEKNEYLPYARSIDVTQDIFKKIKDRIGEETPFFVVSADKYQPQETDMLNICKELDIHFIPFNEALFNHQRKVEGKEVYASDGFHWNEFGHQLIGENLRKEILSVFDF